MRLPLIQFAIPVLAALLAMPAAAPPAGEGSQSQEIVFTAVPARRNPQGSAPIAFAGARLVRLGGDGVPRTLSGGFHSAADPEVSFDGKRLLFAAKRRAEDRWQIFESGMDGAAPRQLTRLDADCRHPVYQSRFFTLDAPTPWDQVAFVAGRQLYTVPIEEARDGKGHPQQITFVRGEVSNPVVAPDGRMLFQLREGEGRPARLFGVNLDGTDYALFHAEPNAELRAAVAVEETRVAVIAAPAGDGAEGGRLAWLSLIRPKESFAWMPGGEALRLHSLSVSPDGTVVAAARLGGRFAMVQLAEEANGPTVLWKDSGFDLLQPKLVAPRARPDGRGSVVDPAVDWALLYCLNVFIGNAADGLPLRKGSVHRVRVMEHASAGERALGEAPVEEDGSFHVRVPANRALRVELLDRKGSVLRRGAWIYARNKEARGCIGCHEDAELTPPNREPMAVRKPAVDLTGAKGGGR